MDGITRLLELAVACLGIAFVIPEVSALVVLNLVLTLTTYGRKRLSDLRRIMWAWCVALLVFPVVILTLGVIFDRYSWEPSGAPPWVADAILFLIFAPGVVGAGLAWFMEGSRWLVFSLTAFHVWVAFCAGMVSYTSVTGIGF